MNCWQCKVEINKGALFCDECSRLQPPSPALNHFERLGLKVQYDLTSQEVVSAHRTLQRKVHPDRFVSKSDRERRFSLEHATALNDAVRTLKDPQKRATYLLSMRGFDIEAENSTIKLNPMFLMEVMELREAISELGGADNQTERAQIEHEVAARYEGTLSTVGLALDDDESTQSNEEIAHLVAELKYLKRMLDQIHGESE